MFFSIELLARRTPLGKLWRAGHKMPHSAAGPSDAHSHDISRQAASGADIVALARVVSMHHAGMPLRVRAVLLCGLVRIYARKVHLTLTDARAALSNASGLLGGQGHAGTGKASSSAAARRLMSMQGDQLLPLAKRAAKAELIAHSLTRDPMALEQFFLDFDDEAQGPGQFATGVPQGVDDFSVFVTPAHLRRLDSFVHQLDARQGSAPPAQQHGMSLDDFANGDAAGGIPAADDEWRGSAGGDVNDHAMSPAAASVAMHDAQLDQPLVHVTGMKRKRASTRSAGQASQTSAGPIIDAQTKLSAETIRENLLTYESLEFDYFSELAPPLSKRQHTLGQQQRQPHLALPVHVFVSPELEASLTRLFQLTDRFVHTTRAATTTFDQAGGNADYDGAGAGGAGGAGDYDASDANMSDPSLLHAGGSLARALFGGTHDSLQLSDAAAPDQASASQAHASSLQQLLPGAATGIDTQDFSLRFESLGADEAHSSGGLAMERATFRFLRWMTDGERFQSPNSEPNFSELISPRSSRGLASNAFLHLLVLGALGHVVLGQSSPYAPIGIQLGEQAWQASGRASCA